MFDLTKWAEKYFSDWYYWFILDGHVCVTNRMMLIRLAEPAVGPIEGSFRHLKDVKELFERIAVDETGEWIELKRVSEELVRCYECEGRGKLTIQKTCPHCKGRQQLKCSCDDPSCLERYDCRTCDAEGTISSPGEDPCPICSGSGLKIGDQHLNRIDIGGNAMIRLETLPGPLEYAVMRTGAANTLHFRFADGDGLIKGLEGRQHECT